MGEFRPHFRNLGTRLLLAIAELVFIVPNNTRHLLPVLSRRTSQRDFLVLEVLSLQLYILLCIIIPNKIYSESALYALPSEVRQARGFIPPWLPLLLTKSLPTVC